MENTTSPKPAPKPRDPNAAPKSFGVTMVDGAGNQLRFRADAKKSGWLTYCERVVVAADGTKTKDRGVTQRHADKSSAEKAVNQGVAAAEAKKWKRASAGGGFRSKPDSFSIENIPTAKAK